MSDQTSEEQQQPAPPPTAAERLRLAAGDLERAIVTAERAGPGGDFSGVLEHRAKAVEQILAEIDPETEGVAEARALVEAATLAPTADAPGIDEADVEAIMAGVDASLSAARETLSSGPVGRPRDVGRATFHFATGFLALGLSPTIVAKAEETLDRMAGGIAAAIRQAGR